MNDTINIIQRTNPFVYLSENQCFDVNSIVLNPPTGLDNFLQTGRVSIVPREIIPMQLDFFTLMLLFFIVGIALLRWYMPDRFFYEISVGNRLSFSRKGANLVSAPALVVDIFHLLNFFFTVSLLTYLFFAQYFNYFLLVYSGMELFLFILLAYILFWGYRRFFIRMISFIFNTSSLSSQQLKIDQNVENLLSVMLLPLLLLAMFSFHKFFLISAVLLALGMQIFRWVQTVSIGISNTRFSAFHFILYLCSLELVPMLIMIKILSPENYF